MGINITETCFTKAFATADNAVTSPIFTDYYILTAEAKEAWYKDIDGNGKIDFATIFLSKNAESLPDSILLINPFNNDERITIGDMLSVAISGNKLQITFPNSVEFEDIRNKSTVFKKNFYGRLFGSHYMEKTFSIEDSVAPIVVSTLYKPSVIKKGNGKIVQDEDKLYIGLAEKVISASPS